MSVPTPAETYAKLIEHIRLSQEDCAMMAHLIRAEGSKEDHVLANAWLTIEELLKRMQWQVTQLAQGRLN